MRSRLILSIVCLATLVAGCGNEESSSEGSGKQPANMCEAVAPAVPEDWELTKKSADKSKAKTDCTLADESGKTTLVVSVVRSPSPAASTTPSRSSATPTSAARRSSDDEQCTKTGPVKLEGAPAQLQRGVRLEESRGRPVGELPDQQPRRRRRGRGLLDDVEDAVSED